MNCKGITKLLAENDCDRGGDTLPAVIKNHIDACTTCQKYHRLAVILNSQKGSLEKAPPEIHPNIVRKIYADIKPLSPFRPFGKFQFPLKPAFAGLFVVLVAAVWYFFLANCSIGHVENLSERFNIAVFKDIKSGDVLYAGDNTTAAIRLKSDGELQLHCNTMVSMKGARHIALSRGEISILSGKYDLTIETPDGLLLARNADAKIRTVARLENGSLKTETRCIVLKGELLIKSGVKETAIRHGQKAVMAGNGAIQHKEPIAETDSQSGKSPVVMQKVLAAVESLCDCIKAAEYTRAKKGNHVLLFGKKVNENKFKVRVFWQEKGLNEIACGVSNGTNIHFKHRRANGS